MGFGKESGTVSFVKKGDPNVVVRDLAAMVNSFGHGTVYVGIDAEGNVSGVAHPEMVSQDIEDAISDSVQPELEARVERMTDGSGKYYLKVCAEGNGAPYCVMGHYHMRNGCKTVRAMPRDIATMYLSGGADVVGDMASPVGDLEFTKLLGRLGGDGESLELAIDGCFRSGEEYNLCAYLM